MSCGVAGSRQFLYVVLMTRAKERWSASAMARFPKEGSPPPSRSTYVRYREGRRNHYMRGNSLMTEWPPWKGRAPGAQAAPRPSTEPTRSVFGFTSLRRAECTSKSLSGELTSPLVSEGSEETWLQRQPKLSPSSGGTGLSQPLLGGRGKTE